jgi:hypothetical protein
MSIINTYNFMKKLIGLVCVTLTVFLTTFPLYSHAQELRDLDSVASKATNIGNLIIALAISLSVLWIIINVVRYFIVEGEESRKKGGMAILFGVVGLFVILSIWGLVAILRNSFRTNDQVPINTIKQNLTLPDPKYLNNYRGSNGGNPFLYDPSHDAGTDMPASGF